MAVRKTTVLLSEAGHEALTELTSAQHSQSAAIEQALTALARRQTGLTELVEWVDTRLGLTETERASAAAWADEQFGPSPVTYREFTVADGHTYHEAVCNLCGWVSPGETSRAAAIGAWHTHRPTHPETDR